MRINMMTVKTRQQRGFTLIEMLLYIAILAIVAVTISSFIFMVYTSRIKTSTISEVEQQGEQTMSLITQNIRNSSSITSPVAGVSASSLTLVEYNGTLSPTVLNQSGNVIQIKEGAGAVVALCSNRVVVSGLSFQNISNSGSHGMVRIQFTLTHINSSNRNEYTYSKTFTSTASLR